MSNVPDLGELNPDCMSLSDLHDLTRQLRNLARYCELKERAMMRRLSGSINAAARDEAVLERMYATLPANWRW